MRSFSSFLRHTETSVRFGDFYLSVSRELIERSRDALDSLNGHRVHLGGSRGTAPTHIIDFRNKIYDGFHSDLKAYKFQQLPLILEAFLPLRLLYSRRQFRPYRKVGSAFHFQQVHVIHYLLAKSSRQNSNLEGQLARLIQLW